MDRDQRSGWTGINDRGSLVTHDGASTELAVEAGAVVAGVGVALVGLLLPAGSLLRALFTLPLLVFLPGYALTTVLFPARDRSGDHASASTGSGTGLGNGLGGGLQSAFSSAANHGPVHASVSRAERLALSFGFSVALVPLLMVGLWAAAGTVALAPFLLLLVFVIALMTGLGLVRRLRLSAENRYQLRYQKLLRAVTDTIANRGAGRGVQIVLLVSVLLLFASFGSAALAPRDGTQYTSVALLTENADGDLVAADYPNELTVTGTQQMVLEVENAEGKPTDYTVVVALHRVEDGTVVESSRLETFSQRVEPGERWTVPHEPSKLIDPGTALSGSNVQLTYLLYTGDPPAEPTRNNAYRSLYVGVEVGSSLTG